MNFGVALVLAAVCGIALSQAPPSFNYYTMDLVFSLPYNGISQPIRIYYDGTTNKSRTGTPPTPHFLQFHGQRADSLTTKLIVQSTTTDKMCTSSAPIFSISELFFRYV